MLGCDAIKCHVFLAVDQLLLTAFSCKSPLSIQISDTIDDTVPSIQSDPCWPKLGHNSITKNIIEHALWRYDSRVYSTFFIFPPDPRYKFVLPMRQGSRPGQSWRPVGNGASFAHVEWKKLHVPDLYCWLPADHGFRLSSKKLSLACLSDVGSSCIYMHLSRTNAAGFQREALPIVSMFARFHPWWTQVQVPSSPTSVSSSNEVRKFSLLNLELSLERATATDTVEASSPGSNSAGTFNQDLFGIEIQRTGRFLPTGWWSGIRVVEKLHEALFRWGRKALYQDISPFYTFVACTALERERER